MTDDPIRPLNDVLAEKHHLDTGHGITYTPYWDSEHRPCWGFFCTDCEWELFDGFDGHDV